MFVNMPGRSGGTDARSASETSGLVKRKKANGRVMHEGTRVEQAWEWRELGKGRDQDARCGQGRTGRSM
jgi:hypothetical protein